MERFTSLARRDAPQFEPIFAALEADQGYVSRSLYMLARDPALLAAVGSMHDAAWYGRALQPRLRDFAAYCFCMFRRAAYSAAHCANNAERHGLDRSKITGIYEAEGNGLYAPDEQALIAFCRAAASTPGTVDDALIARLGRHFDSAQIIELTALMAMMAFLTTWNSVLATDLEAIPRQYAETVLAPMGWEIGQHGQ